MLRHTVVDWEGFTMRRSTITSLILITSLVIFSLGFSVTSAHAQDDVTLSDEEVDCVVAVETGLF